jgi:hypothetical protein
MSNPRRRRTVVVLVTAGVILLGQLPNLVNLIVRPWDVSPKEELARHTEQRVALQAELDARKITREEFNRRTAELQNEFQQQQGLQGQRLWRRTQETAWIVSLAVPPGWVAVGVSELSAGSVLAALLGTLGFGLIAAASLWRAYRTTIRLYTGEFTGQGRSAAAAVAGPAAPADPRRVRLVERRLPWVSEHASAVATAMFHSLLRAPEAKMTLLAPVILLVVFGVMTVATKAEAPVAVRPLMAFGTGAMVLILSGMQLLANQFGYDRSGFRAFVLSPVPRREILLGKNLAVAPLSLGLGLAIVVIVGIAYPMRPDHYLALVAQLLSEYLVLCMLCNAVSIAAPIPIAPGSMQPAQVKIIPAMLRVLLLMVVLPIATVPILLPIGIEALLAELAEVRNVPVSLVLSLLVLGLAAYVYRAALRWQGDWLAAREQDVLTEVTIKGE